MHSGPFDVHVLQTKTLRAHKSFPGQNPLLTVICITFNHKNFLRKCLEEILNQETTFPVEIIIHDDASSDGTTDIVLEYSARYPGLIKSIIQRTNQYSKGLKPGLLALSHAQGAFVAWCEGDDYWVDPQKLQKQVSFLSNNPLFAMSGHDAVVGDESGLILQDSKLPDFYKRDSNPKQLIDGDAWILTLTMVHRNVKFPEASEARCILNGDTFLASRLGWFGHAKYHGDIRPAFYRKHRGGVWSRQSERKRLAMQISSFAWISSYYERVGEEKVAQKYMDRVFLSASAVKMTSVKPLLRELLVRLLQIRLFRRAAETFLGSMKR